MGGQTSGAPGDGASAWRLDAWEKMPEMGNWESEQLGGDGGEEL